MNYPALCAALRDTTGSVPLWDARHPELGVPYAELAEFILRERDGFFEVGILDRGAFVLAERFDSESAACDYIFAKATAAKPSHHQTVEEERRSAQIDAEFFKQVVAKRNDAGTPPD